MAPLAPTIICPPLAKASSAVSCGDTSRSYEESKHVVIKGEVSNRVYFVEFGTETVNTDSPVVIKCLNQRVNPLSAAAGKINISAAHTHASTYTHIH